MTGINYKERKCLEVLAEQGNGGMNDFCYLHFRTIMDATKLTRAEVRRAVRSLARKGLTQYAKGLWTEDGEMFGAGYCCTDGGLKHVDERDVHSKTVRQ